MNKEEYYIRLKKTTEKIKTDRCSEDEMANINRQKLYLAEHYISSLEQENEKLHSYKTLYQSLKRQKEELRSWLKEDKDKIKVYDTKNNKAVELGIIIGLGMCVEKLEELE